MNLHPDPRQCLNRLISAGFDTTVAEWIEAMASLVAGEVPEDPRLDEDVARAQPLLKKGWEMLDRLPLRSRRNPGEKAAGQAIMDRACGSS